MISDDNICVIQDIVDKLNRDFGTTKPKQACYVQQQEYLGIDIDFNPQEVKITMYKYLEDVLAEAVNGMEGIPKWSANKHLF